MTVTYALMRRAVKNFPAHDMTSKEVVKVMRRKWIQSVVQLGDNWLLSKPVKRITRRRRAV